MKELSMEEKAKAYDEAREKIAVRFGTNVAEEIFSEFEESEDERIRKEIIDFIDTKTIDSDERRSRWFSYLEKYKPISFTSLEDTEVKMSLMRYISELNQDVVHIHPGIEICNGWIAWLEKQGNPADINPSEFDLRLNKLLKQFETLPKEELASSLSFYLNTVQNDGTYKDEEKQGEKQTPQSNERAWLYLVADVLTWMEGIGQYLDNPKVQELAKKLQKEYGQKLYIEKQGEQKPSDKAKPKFKVGDWVVDGNFVTQITGIEDDGYTNSDQGFISFETAKKFHLWTIQDARDGDVLFMDNGSANCIFIYKSSNNGIINKYASCNNFGFEGEHYLVLNDGYVIPATKEQRDTLIKAMAEAGYTFDFEKKELKKIERKSTWIEEDKKLTDVNHEYFSELLENNNSKNINDYAYQVAYCMSHDWIEETATWDDVQKACKLGAEWKEKHWNNSSTAWSEEDEEHYQACLQYFDAVNPDMVYYKDYQWLKSLKERIGE